MKGVGGGLAPLLSAPALLAPALFCGGAGAVCARPSVVWGNFSASGPFCIAACGMSRRSANVCGGLGLGLDADSGAEFGLGLEAGFKALFGAGGGRATEAGAGAAVGFGGANGSVGTNGSVGAGGAAFRADAVRGGGPALAAAGGADREAGEAGSEAGSEAGAEEGAGTAGAVTTGTAAGGTGIRSCGRCSTAKAASAAVAPTPVIHPAVRNRWDGAGAAVSTRRACTRAHRSGGTAGAF